MVHYQVQYLQNNPREWVGIKDTTTRAGELEILLDTRERLSFEEADDRLKRLSAKLTDWQFQVVELNEPNDHGEEID